jgi:hypothetical protein
MPEYQLALLADLSHAPSGGASTTTSSSKACVAARVDLTRERRLKVLLTWLSRDTWLRDYFPHKLAQH